MTRFYTWQEVFLMYGVIGTGIIYCVCTHFVFKKWGQRIGDIVPIVEAETPGDNVVLPKVEYREEEKRLKRRYIRNKMTPMEDHIQEAFDSCYQYNCVP